MIHRLRTCTLLLACACLLLVTACNDQTSPATETASVVASPLASPVKEATVGVTATAAPSPSDTLVVTDTSGAPQVVDFKGLPEVGGKLVFATDASTDVYHIAVMDMSNGSVKTLTDSSSPGDAEPWWSPDGKSIIFSSGRDGASNFSIYQMQATGDNQEAIVVTDGRDNFAPAVSPDGAKIAFHTNRDGNLEVYVANIDGSNQVNVTNNPANDSQPGWSADNQKLLFTSDRSGDNRIYEIGADGSGDVRDVFGAQDWNAMRPRYSPDGKKIVFGLSNRYSVDNHVMIMNADGSDEQQITSGNGQYGQATWMDNTHLVFCGRRAETEKWQLMIATLQPDGGIFITPITSATSNSNNPNWIK